MKHKMNLWNDSFKAIKDGWKTIEMRLNDEKRSKIEIGDEIEFTNIKTNETLICKVTNLFKYNNFDELYNNHNKISIGYTKDESANQDDILINYSKMINGTINGAINENEKNILDIILKNPKITIAEMSIKSNKSIRTINRILNSLKEKNLLKRMNSNKDGYWEVLK